jgi:hypothetical protein
LTVAFVTLIEYMSSGCRKTTTPIDVKEQDRDDAVLFAISRDGKFYLGEGAKGLANTGTQIRVRNASDSDMREVIIDGNKFGDLKKQSITFYRNSGAAYEFPSVSLLVDSKFLPTQQLGTHGSRTPLGPGRFTYVLAVEGGHLYVRVEKDKG